MSKDLESAGIPVMKSLLYVGAVLHITPIKREKNVHALLGFFYTGKGAFKANCKNYSYEKMKAMKKKAASAATSYLTGYQMYHYTW